MTPRQTKIVFVAVGAFVTCTIAYWVVFGLFINPANRLKAQKAQLIADVNTLTDQNRKKGAYEDSYRNLAAQALPGSETEAGSYLASTVMTLLDYSGLTGPGKLLSSQPLQPKAVNGFREIGHSIRVKGKLTNLVDLLYLLQSQPFLHRLDNLTLNRAGNSGDFDLAFHYCALLVDPARNKRVKPAPPTTQAAPVQDLDTPQRRQYDAIAARDLFRPYVKRIVEPPPPPPPVNTGGPRPTPPPPPPSRRQDFQVCGLTTWEQGNQVVAIRNGSDVRYYKPGDKVESGEIVMIDYRPLPKPDNPKLESPSRVILKIGQDYWAVELEKNLSDKRLLKPDQWPPELRDSPSSAPGDGAGQQAPAEANLTLK